MITGMQEEWRPVVGFEGYYEVSNRGRVRALERAEHVRSRWGGTCVRRYPARELTPVRTDHGHLTVTLRREGIGNPRGVHVLVAEAFHGPGRGRHALHHNDVPDDNWDTNLYWGSPAENSRDALTNGRNHNAKKAVCKRQHGFAGANLVMEGAKRRCKACKQTHLHFFQRGVFPTEEEFRAEADRRFAIIMAA
jgi:hypothetical protein